MPISLPSTAINGQIADATAVMADLNALLGGVNSALMRDGTSLVAADMPFAGYKITGLGMPTITTDAATKGYVDTATVGLQVGVKAFGAKGDGVTDDSAAIRIAIAATAAGGEVFFQTGTYLVSQDGANAWCLNVPATVRLVGVSSGASVLRPAATVPDTCDIIRIYPSAIYDNRGGGVFDLAILYPNNGTRAGRDAIRIDTLTTAASSITGFEIARVQTGSPTAATPGYAIGCFNDGVANPSGGIFGAHFHDNVLNGGVRLSGSGDSMKVCKNTLTGPNVGVWATLVNGLSGPSSQLVLEDNNITSTGGCYRIEVGASTFIRGTNGENTAPGALANNGGALIYFPKPAAWSAATAYTIGAMAYQAGQSYRCILANTNQAPPNATYWAATDPAAGSIVEGNLISMFGTSDANTLVDVECGTGITVRNNRLLNGLGGVNCLTVGAAAIGTIVGPNIYNSTTGEANRVVDAGVGTIGVVQTLALVNGWATIGTGDAAPSVVKDQEGFVTITGSMTGGTTGTGTLAAVLPPGFRPALTERFFPGNLNGTTYQTGEIVINTNGNVIIGNNIGATRVALLHRFRAVGGANGSVF